MAYQTGLLLSVISLVTVIWHSDAQDVRFQSSLYTVDLNSTTTLKCSITTTKKFEGIYGPSGKIVESGGRYTVIEYVETGRYHLTIAGVRENDNGKYKCKAMGGTAADEAETVLQIRGNGPSSCAVVLCPQYSVCAVIDGRASCQCHMCKATYSPVCGSDGVTYDNYCALNRASCVQRKQITFAYRGSCLPGCSSLRCEYHSVCRPVDGLPKCVCAMGCPKIYAPVCGSDGKTYANDCMLKANACSQRKNITVAKRGRCESASCDGMLCAHYSECKVLSGKAQCVCPTVCPRVYLPVCGTNNKTYPNDCEMKVLSCQTRKPIYIKSKGQCTVSPCATVRCGYYAMCHVVNNTAKCVCPLICPAVFRPVCGSDGITYGNDCGLRAASCRAKKSIRIAHNGVCNITCANIYCGNYSGCQMIDGKPKCVCRTACPEIYSPVCGSDGKTYSIECELKALVCQRKAKIFIRSRGACHEPTGKSTCATVKCDHYSNCEVVNGSAKCVCATNCIALYDPVCGTDGKTYSNKCRMMVQSCLSQTSTEVAHKGECHSSPCDTVRCGYYSSCKEVGGNGVCLCNSVCATVYDPVCGSDGKTHSSECRMKLESCRSQTMIYVKYKGVCNKTQSDCSSIKCGFNGKCFVRNGVASCGCPVCGALYSPVCASDGKTYSNDCAVITESCLKQKAITVVQDRACGAPSRAAVIAIPTSVGFISVSGLVAVAILVYFKVYRMRRRTGKIHQFATFTNEEQKS